MYLTTSTSVFKQIPFSYCSDLSSDIAEKVCHPSGLSRRLSEVDFLTKLQLMEHSESMPEDVNLSIPVVNCIDKFTRFKALKTIGCGMDNETIDALRRERECTSVARIMVLYTGGTIGKSANLFLGFFSQRVFLILTNKMLFTKLTIVRVISCIFLFKDSNH